MMNASTSLKKIAVGTTFIEQHRSPTEKDVLDSGPSGHRTVDALKFIPTTTIHKSKDSLGFRWIANHGETKVTVMTSEG